MLAPDDVHAALAAAGLVEGLASSEIRSRLLTARRLADCGRRALAFYLVEMEERRLYQDTDHGSTAHYAEDALDLDRRRTAEMIRMGRLLRTLPRIDVAFCKGEVGWSRLEAIARVVTPEHEQAWLETASTGSMRDLQDAVRRTKPGDAPPERGRGYGTPHSRYHLQTTVGATTQRKIELAQEKLSEERGEPVTLEALFDKAAELILTTAPDGTVPGRKAVSTTLYQLIVYEDAEGKLELQTNEGLVPIEDDGIRERAERIVIRDDDRATRALPPGTIDRETPPRMKHRVKARDGQCCQNCGSRHNLHVHHIELRSEGGRTWMVRLVTLCGRCHGRVHEGSLRIESENANRRVRFFDREGRELNVGERFVESAWIPELPRAEDLGVRMREARADCQEARPDPLPPEQAFAGLIGQEKRIQALATAAIGSRARGRPFPHTLFAGPAGVGKTTLARGVARLAGAQLHETTGPVLQDVPTLLRLLAALGEGDALFVDEIHAVPRSVLEVLYAAMTEGKVPSPALDAAGWTGAPFHLPPFTLLAATTEDGDLPPPLLSRFGLEEHVEFHDEATLAFLATTLAAEEGLTLDASAAQRIARCARGTPRETRRLVERVLEAAAAEGRVRVDASAVTRVLSRLGYDERGLGPIELRVLALLEARRRPVSLARLASTIGASVTRLARDVEPWLVRRGFLQVTPHGRALATG